MYLCRKKSFAANLIAFSGVINKIFTADPLYIPLKPSARYVFLKQSSIDEYIRSPFGPTYVKDKIGYYRVDWNIVAVMTKRLIFRIEDN